MNIISTRKIIHIDMDAFFASVEQMDNPDIKGKPVAVGGSRDRGVVAAASYEARKFGISSAMPSKIAYRRCPQLIFVKPRFDRYKEISKQVMKIFHDYTDLVEPLSIDEAFLDVSINKKNILTATEIATEIRQRIKDEIGLTASAGVSINKFLAKIASDYNKPDGIYVITPKKAEKFIEQLPINIFHGIGKVTSKKMHKLGIFRGLELKKMSKEDLIRHFGKQGIFFFNIARAIDYREVNPNRIRKSVGTEHTFNKDISDIELIKLELMQISEKLFLSIKKNNSEGRTITLKIKYSNFVQQTKSKTLVSNIIDITSIKLLALDLLKQIHLHTSIRLIGLTISNLYKHQEAIQLRINFNEEIK